MVLKRSKFGLNTGNSLAPYRFRSKIRTGALVFGSLRFSYQATLAQFDAQGESAFLHIGERRMRFALDLLGLSSDGAGSQLSEVSLSASHAQASTVSLSLNKQRRWQLTESLYNCLNYGHFDRPYEHKWYEESRERSDGAAQRSKRKANRSKREYLNEHVQDFAVELVQSTTINKFSMSNYSESIEWQAVPAGLLCSFYAHSDYSYSFARSGDMMPYADAKYKDLRDAAFKQQHVDEELAANSGANKTKRERKKQRKARHNAHFRGTQRREVFASPNQSVRRVENSRSNESVCTERAQLSFVIQEPGRLTTQRCFRDPASASPHGILKNHNHARRDALRAFALEAKYEYEFDVDDLDDVDELEDGFEQETQYERGIQLEISNLLSSKSVVSSSRASFSVQLASLADEEEEGELAVGTSSVVDDSMQQTTPRVETHDVATQSEVASTLPVESGQKAAVSSTKTRLLKLKRIEPTVLSTNASHRERCAFCNEHFHAVRGGLPASLGKIWIKRANGRLANRRTGLPPLMLKGERKPAEQRLVSKQNTARPPDKTVPANDRIDALLERTRRLLGSIVDQSGPSQPSETPRPLETAKAPPTATTKLSAQVQTELSVILEHSNLKLPLQSVNSDAVQPRSINDVEPQRSNQSAPHTTERVKVKKKKLHPVKLSKSSATNSMNSDQQPVQPVVSSESVKTKLVVKPHLGRVILDSRILIDTVPNYSVIDATSIRIGPAVPLLKFSVLTSNVSGRPVLPAIKSTRKDFHNAITADDNLESNDPNLLSPNTQSISTKSRGFSSRSD